MSGEGVTSPQQLWLPNTGHIELYETEAGPVIPALVPPQHRRLILPGEKFETPVDYRGIVDIDKTVELVASTVDPDYQWRGEIDEHHAHWESDWYRGWNLFTYDNSRLLSTFVDLPINKVLLPREFHKYLHEITLPVGPPTESVMQARVQSWFVVSRLFLKIKDIERDNNYAMSRAKDVELHPERTENNAHEGRDVETVYWYASQMRRHFKGVQIHLKDLARVPDEFRLLEPDLIESILDMPDDPTQADAVAIDAFRSRVGQLGHAASRGALDSARLPREKLAA